MRVFRCFNSCDFPMEDKSVFGYGSLILPVSTISRFYPELGEQSKQVMKDSDNRLKELIEFYLQDDQLEKWRNSKLEFIPAKIYGFKRYYALEREGEGNQLTAVEGDEKEFINGVVIFPLNQGEFEDLSDTEDFYNKHEVKKDEIETYFEVEKNLPEKVILFTGTDHPQINMDTEIKRDNDYHRFIEEGAKLLAEERFSSKKESEKFRERFMEDFNEHTYEKHEGDWVKLSDIDEN